MRGGGPPGAVGASPPPSEGGSSGSRRLVGGLLSGTSADGIDALLLEVEGSEPLALGWRVVAFRSIPWDDVTRDRIRRAMTPGGADAPDLVALHVELGRAFARAFLALLDEAGVAPGEVAAVGSHGQTLWHEPPNRGGRGWTLQLGDPATLAEETGVPVVSDFRARDMAAGGHGAPLVPWCDRVLLHRPGVGQALQNLGGMGNVTWLPPDGDPAGILGFDTGPGVALLDAAAQLASRGRDRFDREGARAARGKVDPALLATLLDDPFFREAPPRSTGRERFGDARLGDILRGWGRSMQAPGDWDDLLATLAELTARSVAAAYRDFLPVAALNRVVLAGGGARNPHLVERIRVALAETGVSAPVETGPEALGIDPDAREAAAFALLAWAHLEGVPATLPQVTGTRGARVLGSWTPGAA